MFKIYKNFAGKHLEDAIYDMLNSSNFKWEFHDVTSHLHREDVEQALDKNLDIPEEILSDNYQTVHDKSTFETPQCVHQFGLTQPENRLMTPLIYKIMDAVDGDILIDRCKANLMFPYPGNPGPNFYNRAHVDYPQSYAKTLIYYVNDSDGDTFLFKNRYQDGKHPGKLEVVDRYTPKKGSAVLFDSTQYHASSPPTKGKRFVINFIFWKKADAPQQSAWVFRPGDPMPKIPGFNE